MRALINMFLKTQPNLKMATFDFLYREQIRANLYLNVCVFLKPFEMCVDIVGNFISERTQIDFNEKTELT